jgi:hypothetical protein
VLKGFSFSFIVVFLTITLLSFIALQKSMVTHQRENIYVKSRITDMNRMYESMTRDVNKAIEIIARRSMSVIINQVVSDGVGTDQADLRIEELMVSGTLNGTVEYLMENSTIGNWTDNMEGVAGLKGYDLDLAVYNIDVKPYDSWYIMVTGDMDVNISERNGVANISRHAQVSKLVPVEDLEDPLYALNTLGRGTNIVERTDGDFTRFLTTGDGKNGYASGESAVVNSSDADGVPDKDEKILVTDDASSLQASLVNQFKAVVSSSDIPAGVTVPTVANASSIGVVPDATVILVDGSEGKVWNIDTLYTHANESRYYPSTNGPSFLDRLEGKYQVQAKYSSQTSNVIGIESFVDKGYLDDLEIFVRMNQTNVDYIYFSNSTVGGDKVKGLPASFRLDDQSTIGSTRHEVYEVEDLIV